MRRLAWFPLLLVALLVVGPAGPAAAQTLAQEEMVDEMEEPQPAQFGDVVPAEIVETEAEPEADQPWTSRFLIPTFLLLAALGFGAAVLYYAVRIRARYTVSR